MLRVVAQHDGCFGGLRLLLVEHSGSLPHQLVKSNTLKLNFLE